MSDVIQNPEDMEKMLTTLDALTQRLEKLEGQSPHKGLITILSSLLIIFLIVSDGISLSSDNKVATAMDETTKAINKSIAAIDKSIEEGDKERKEFRSIISAVHITLAEYATDFRHLEKDVAANTSDIKALKSRIK